MAECGLLEAWIPSARTASRSPDNGRQESNHLLPQERAADAAKYEARKEGRCQQTLYSDGDSSPTEYLRRTQSSGSPVISTYYRVLIIVCIGFNSTVVGAAISMMMPFFSTVALRKSPDGGIASHTAIGFIFGIATLVEFIAAPFMAKDLPKAGSKLMLLLSATEIAGMVLLFGFVNRIDNWPTFLVLCLLIRLVQGVSTAANFVSANSIAVGALPDSTGTVNGALRAFNGFGYAAGPALGGFLYDAAGYTLPFYIGSGLLFTNTVILAFILPSKESHLSPSSLKHDVDYCSILRLPWIWIVLISVFVANMVMGFLEPTYPVFLNVDYGVPLSYGGLGLLIWGLVYSTASPIVGYCVDRWLRPRLVQMTGLFLCAIGCLLVGPAPFLPSSDSFGLSYFAMVLLAAGSSFALTAASPDIFHTLEENGFKNPVAYRAAVAGLYQASLSVGYGAGPVLGSTLTAWIGFRASTFLLGVVYFGWMVLVALVMFVIWIQSHRQLYSAK